MVLASAVLLVLAACVTEAQGAGVAPGWRMVDRFAGFRYEVKGNLPDPAAFTIEARDAADELAGFGWAQVSPRGTVVGEFRGTPATAEAFQTWLAKKSRQARAVERVEVRQYPDTKIRYHFSHFKVLDPRRETCFDDAPHACSQHVAPAQGAARSEL